MNYEYIKLFIRVASTQNISLAGSELGLSPAVASLHINKLEESLEVRLLHRTTRKVSLTEEGKSFLPHAKNILASVDIAKQSIGKGSSSPTGTLRITAPASFGRMHLMKGLEGFLNKYQQLKIDFRLSDSIVDMIDGGFDIAIRNAELKDSSMMAKKLAPDNRIVCASPKYLDKHSEPKKPMDLLNHQCINLIGLENWSFKTPQGIKNIKSSGILRTDNGDIIREACIDGIGISINSTWSAYQALKNGQLIQILKNYPLISDTAIWAVYPNPNQLAPKVRAFIDYFTEYFGGTPYWDKE